MGQQRALLQGLFWEVFLGSWALYCWAAGFIGSGGSVDPCSLMKLLCQNLRPGALEGVIGRSLGPCMMNCPRRLGGMSWILRCREHKGFVLGQGAHLVIR